MRKFALIAAPLLALTATAPAFSQGAMMSPPSPNAANNQPQSPNSVPPGARTLPPNTTGIAREGAIETTRFGDATGAARDAARPATNPDAPEGRTVPVPQSR